MTADGSAGSPDEVAARASPWRLDDPRRLAALAETGLLDSPPDETFDRFTRLVARALDVPTALVSLVDAAHRSTKSAVGAPGPLAAGRRSPLDATPCAHVVAGDAVLVLPDARRDLRVASEASVTEHGTVAYAGVPLRTPEGVPIGALCALDAEVRAWTATDLAILEDLAGALGGEIGGRVLAVRQRSFVASASHRLRTPLTAMRLQLEELAHLSDDPAVDEVTGELLVEVDRLAATVTDLLGLARDGRFSHEREVALHTLLADVARRWDPLARVRGREVRCGAVEPVVVLVAEAALRQIVEVLVENALDHGHGTVTLELHERDGHTRLLVRDEGPGLDPRAAARTFQRDEGGGQAERGVGLSFADETAGRLGGRLVLLPGAPTTFELVLPHRTR